MIEKPIDCPHRDHFNSQFDKAVADKGLLPLTKNLFRFGFQIEVDPLLWIGHI